MPFLRRHRTDWSHVLAETVQERRRAQNLAQRAELAAATARQRNAKNHLTEAIVDFVTKGKHA